MDKLEILKLSMQKEREEIAKKYEIAKNKIKNEEDDKKYIEIKEEFINMIEYLDLTPRERVIDKIKEKMMCSGYMGAYLKDDIKKLMEEKLGIRIGYDNQYESQLSMVIIREDFNIIFGRNNANKILKDFNREPQLTRFDIYANRYTFLNNRSYKLLQS